MTLRGRFWRGSDVAVLVAHDFGNTTSGSRGQRAEQSGETVLWLSGALARQGLTVFSPDYRGHGLSDGEIDKRAGSTDMRAAYTWLQDQGASEIVVLGWVGSGTVAAHLDATDETVDFTGIVLAFSPPQEIGHDAQSVIADLTTPVYMFGINTGTTARFAKLLSDAAGNSLGYHVFDAVPSGLTFVDVFGPEMAGRVIAFVETVAS
jgi:alpha/beta superfamily hydrolase